VPGVICHVECHNVVTAVNGGHDLDRHADEQWPLIAAAADYERLRLFRTRAVLDPGNSAESATVRKENRIPFDIVKLHTNVFRATGAAPACITDSSAALRRPGARGTRHAVRSRSVDPPNPRAVDVLLHATRAREQSVRYDLYDGGHGLRASAG
jgi:hypothetical protein